MYKSGQGTDFSSFFCQVEAVAKRLDIDASGEIVELRSLARPIT
jgi:hypothetical protein